MFHTVISAIGTFVFVQALIILFAAPFYTLHYVRTRHLKDQPATLSERIEQFFLSKESNWLVFCWAMSEALFWFVIPEFLLLLIVFMRIRRKRELLVYDVGGTVAGTIIAFFL